MTGTKRKNRTKAMTPAAEIKSVRLMPLTSRLGWIYAYSLERPRSLGAVGWRVGAQRPKWHMLIAMNPVYVVRVSPLGMPSVMQANCPGPTVALAEYW